MDKEKVSYDCKDEGAEKRKGRDVRIWMRGR